MPNYPIPVNNSLTKLYFFVGLLHALFFFFFAYPFMFFVGHHVGHNVGRLVVHLVHLHVGHHVQLNVGHRKYLGRTYLPTYGRTDGLTGGGVGAKDTQILLLYCHRHSEINFTLTAVSSTVSIAKLGTVIFILHSCKYVGGVESTVTVNWSLPINWSLPSQLIPSLSTGPFPVNWSLPSQLIPSQSTDQSSQSS